MRMRLLRALVGTAALTLLIAGCSSSPGSADGIIRVPGDVATLVEAEERASPGDMILVAPGVYEEQLLITTPDITIRGEDRNDTVVDGSGIRPYAIVAMADGVRVENLTVSNATFYGLLFTGLHDDSGPSAPTANDYQMWDPEEFPPLQRFHADHITAINNGLYGIYAFNSQNGIITRSYASGSADSGIYVGQCADCNIAVTENVAERNAVGFENANASGPLLVEGNRFSQNRVGMTFLSSYQEAFVPQKGNLIAGNLIIDNTAEETSAQANGGFGTGIGISGGIENVFVNNLISGHTRAGVVLENAEDLSVTGNLFEDNVFVDNQVEYANISAVRAPAIGNCDPEAALTIPPALQEEMRDCDSGKAQPASDATLEPPTPPGISFRDIALPLPQPNLPEGSSYDRLPDVIEIPSHVDSPVPASDLFADLAGHL